MANTYFKESSRDLMWIHLAFLFSMILMPLMTRLLGEFIPHRSTLLLYWVNILMPGAMLYWSWSYALRNDLVKEDTAPRYAGRSAGVC